MSLGTMAAGEVTIGMSCPVVALYAASAGVVSYSGGMDLARGVSINPQITAANANNIFYANNGAAERGKPKFSNGTIGVTVDGLLIAAEKLISGIPATSKETVTVGSTAYELTNNDDDQNIPYVGFGVVLKRQSNDQQFFRAWIYRKVQFAQFDVPANTEGENIDWQTTALSAGIFRDDTAKHAWRSISGPIETELEAYNVIRTFLGLAAAENLPDIVQAAAQQQEAQPEQPAQQGEQTEQPATGDTTPPAEGGTP